MADPSNSLAALATPLIVEKRAFNAFDTPDESPVHPHFCEGTHASAGPVQKHSNSAAAPHAASNNTGPLLRKGPSSCEEVAEKEFEFPAAFTKRTRRALLVVWLTLFCDYVLMTLAVPIFPLLEVSEMATGCLFAAKAAFQILASPFAIKFVDNHLRTMVVCGFLLEILSLLMFAGLVPRTYSAWLAARALSGVASAFLTGGSFALLGKVHSRSVFLECCSEQSGEDEAPNRIGATASTSSNGVRGEAPDLDAALNSRRAGAMGAAVTGVIAGVCLGPLFGGFLYDLQPSLPFLVLALAEVAVLLMVFAVYPRKNNSGDVVDLEGNSTDYFLQEEEEEPPVQEVSVFELLRHPVIGAFLFSVFLANAQISTLESTLGSFTMDQFGLSPSLVGAFYMFNSVPSCLCSGKVAWFSEQIIERKLFSNHFLKDHSSKRRGSSSCGEIDKNNNNKAVGCCATIVSRCCDVEAKCEFCKKVRRLIDLEEEALEQREEGSPKNTSRSGFFVSRSVLAKTLCLALALFVQGLFTTDFFISKFVLFPNLAVSMFGLGAGMGMVDGLGPAVLGEVFYFI